MCNQPIFGFFFPTFLDLLPSLIIAGIFFWGFGLVMIINYLKIREGKARAAMEPLCVWQYSSAEWQKYAELYELAKFPKGAAKVSLTLLDVWIRDDAKVRRTILDDMRKCVTACKFEKQMLKIRIRSWACPNRFGSVIYSVEDVFLPVPIGKEQDAVEAVKLFSENIVRMNKKVVSVMPDNFINGIISENNF